VASKIWELVRRREEGVQDHEGKSCKGCGGRRHPDSEGKLDRRLEEFLTPYVCDTVINQSDDVEIGTKCLGYAFDLHVHIEYTVAEETEGCVVIGTVVPTRVEGMGE
jgi:hypothetical protein